MLGGRTRQLAQETLVQRKVRGWEEGGKEPIGLHRKEPHLGPRFSLFVSWLSSLHSGPGSESFHTTACEQMGCESLHGRRLKKQYGVYCVVFAQPLERWEHL